MAEIGFVFRRAPHGCTSGREGLDAILATSAYTENLAVYFIGDGVFQLLKSQKADEILCRDYISTFKMLEMYDVENIYVCEASLQARGLTIEDLLIDVTVLPQAVLAAQLHHCTSLMTY